MKNLLFHVKRQRQLVSLGILFLMLIFCFQTGTRNTEAKSNKVHLKKSSLTVGIGSGYSETIRILQGKKKLAGQDFTFRSSDPKVAKVNKKGIVTGKKPGMAKIVCKRKDGSQKLTCKITVMRYVEEITVGDGYLNFTEIGETRQLPLTIYPKNATVQKFRYKSSNPDVVTIDPDGMVTCTGEGTAKITVTATDPLKMNTMVDVCLVTGFQEPFGISQEQNIPHGKVTTIKYPSTAYKGNAKRKAVVYTPPGYTTEKKYNVLYLLHGGGDDETSWTQNGGAHYIMDYLYDKNLVEDMIVVMPNNSNATAAEQDLSGSLAEYLTTHYSIATGPEHTAVAGYSLGGLCASYVVLKSPEKYSYLGCISTAGEYFQELFIDKLADPGSTFYNSPLKVVWLSIGTADTLVMSSHREAKRTLESQQAQEYFKNYGTQYYCYERETETSHSWLEWQNGLYNFARLIFR